MRYFPLFMQYRVSKKAIFLEKTVLHLAQKMWASAQDSSKGSPRGRAPAEGG